MRLNYCNLRSLLLLLSVILFSSAKAQTYITWQQATGGVTGTFPGGTVTVTQSGGASSIDFVTPSYGDPDLVVTGNQTFSTLGPNVNPPSNTTTFTFSVPVIITQYNMADIDRSDYWNDSMQFTGVTFTTTAGQNCTPSVTGALATTDALPDTEWAKWFMSTTPVSSFTINYVGVPGSLTHAYLGYSMEVMLANVTNTVTVNSPILCPGNTATITASNSIPGTYSYVWTVPPGVTDPGNVASFTTNVAGTYTVIVTNVNSGISAPAASGTVTALPFIAPTFTAVAAICAGDPLAALPTTSLEGVTGTWSPAINNMATTTYTFTPSIGLCSAPTTLTINVTPQTTPIFTQVAAICSGSPLAALPTTSNNGITGTWSPAINNTATTTYTFTPTIGQCASSVAMTVTVNQPIQPTFVQPNPICAGESLAALPVLSTNGITGTWSPAINNMATTTYTFTPAIGECATAANLTIVVNPIINPTFAAIAPICFGQSVVLPTTSNNAITGTWSPEFNPNATTTYTFTPTGGQCAAITTTTVEILPEFTFEILETCVNSEFVLTVAPLNSSFDLGTATYEWEIGGVTVGNDDASLNVSALINGTVTVETLPLNFTVNVTDANGCTVSNPYTVTNMYCGIQKGISVNGDGSNEFFDLRLLNVAQLQIFNRYGMEIYSKKNYFNEWIGQTDSGEMVPDGVYYYRIDFASGERSKTGWIYVISKT